MHQPVLRIKEQIASQWGIPKHEQKLLCGMLVCQNNASVGELVGPSREGAILDLFCVRTCPFRFQQELGHSDLQITDEGDGITHSGDGLDQAGFLSDVLEPDDNYRTHIRFSSTTQWTSIFIGVARDDNRNWDYLDGAYIGYGGADFGGFYVDDPTFMCNPRSRGWVKVSAMTELFQNHSGDKTVEFIMAMDMGQGRLACLTVDGEELGSIKLQCVGAPLRLAAIVSCPGHSVRIVS